MKIVPKNWREFQHYKDRNPPWIRLHKKLLDNKDWHRLPLASKALAPMLWLLASESITGSIDGSLDDIAFRLRTTEDEVSQGLTPLIERGFFTVEQDVSDVLADGLQSAVPMHCITEACTETEAETSQSAAPPAVAVSASPKPEYPDDFLMAWDAYPKRPGANKKAAHKAWAARIKAHADPVSIANGCAAYRKYCDVTGTAGNFIKAPETFFGPDEHYLTNWLEAIPLAQSGQARASPTNARDEARAAGYRAFMPPAAAPRNSNDERTIDITPATPFTLGQ